MRAGRRPDEGRPAAPQRLSEVHGQPGVIVCPACAVDVTSLLDERGNPTNNWSWSVSGSIAAEPDGFWRTSGASSLAHPWIDLYDSHGNRFFGVSIAASNPDPWLPPTGSVQTVRGRSDPGAPRTTLPVSAVLRWIDNNGAPYEQAAELRLH